MSWKQLNSKEVYKNDYLTVTQDDVLTDKGTKLTYGIVHKKPAVAIVALDGEYTYLISEYRYPVREWVWGFPMGHHESENPEISAKHELEEEAGLTAQKLQEIGRFYLAPGHNTQEFFVYVATGLKDVGQKPEASEEGINVKKVKISELPLMVKEGKIKDGPTLACINFLEIYLKR